MRPIPLKMRKEMADDPFYSVCVHESVQCGGRIEFDHVFIYAGKQVNEKWAILPTCREHHVHITQFRKESERIAVARATPEELSKYPRKNWSLYR